MLLSAIFMKFHMTLLSNNKCYRENLSFSTPKLVRGTVYKHFTPPMVRFYLTTFCLSRIFFYVSVDLLSLILFNIEKNSKVFISTFTENILTMSQKTNGFSGVYWFNWSIQILLVNE